LTIRSTDVPELDVAAVSAAYVRSVSETCPEQLQLATRLLERLPPARWTLEWHLPWWLGQAFGLDGEIARDIVLSNLLGLGSIRLQDDLADGEVAPEDVAAARTLGAALYEAALVPYRLRLDPGSPFWAHLESCMAEWRAATLGAAQGRREDQSAEDGSAEHQLAEDHLAVDHLAEHRLAARGAPLRISAFAVCLLADHVDAFPAIRQCLDHALEAMVLYDHVADWEADLDAGRWNAFVAEMSSGPQVPAQRDRHRSAVFVAMMTTDVAAAYHGRIEFGMLRAAALADAFPVPVPSLGAHFRRFATAVNEHGALMRHHYQGLGERAANLLLPTPVDARS
jgi:hypothetical protein